MTNYKLTYHESFSNQQYYSFVVIAAQFEGMWIWVRKVGANTWELPTGHVEKDETPDVAARRELWEETGALDFSLVPITDFSIQHQGKTSYNRLFFADILKMDKLPRFEIEERIFTNEAPTRLTYGNVQLELIKKVVGRINNTETKFG